MKIAQMNTSLLYEGVALEIFIPGCLHQCEGCQNPELWKFDAGKKMSYLEIMEELKSKVKNIDTIVLTGGDPLWNKEETLVLAHLIKDEFPNIKLWMYTGFSKEDIEVDPIMLSTFEICDVVVTDKYDSSFPANEYAGSCNQRMWKNK